MSLFHIFFESIFKKNKSALETSDWVKIFRFIEASTPSVYSEFNSVGLKILGRLKESS